MHFGGDDGIRKSALGHGPATMKLGGGHSIKPHSTGVSWCRPFLDVDASAPGLKSQLPVRGVFGETPTMFRMVNEPLAALIYRDGSTVRNSCRRTSVPSRLPAPCEIRPAI